MQRKQIQIGLIIALLILAIILLPGCGSRPKDTIVIGGKKFSEQSILGEMYAALIKKHTNLKVERRFWLGGTQVVHQAILRGDIDMYPEYTGTAYQVILKQSGQNDPQRVFEVVKKEYARQFHLQWLDPIGFNNTYALTIRRSDSTRLNLKTISDLSAHSHKLTAGLDPEFLERPDGWPGLMKIYNIKLATKPRQMDPGLVYRAVANGDVDVVDTYSTDGRIPAFKLVILTDNKRFFPPYYAAPVVREDVLETHPDLKKVLNMLAGKVSEAEMQQLNYEVDQREKRPEDVAQKFLRDKGLL